MPSLADYQLHVEKFGPELVLETAAHELGEQDMGELAALIASRDRVYRFKAGSWIERRIKARACADCGLDLPATASPSMRRHPHCKHRARSRAKRARMVLRQPSGNEWGTQQAEERPTERRQEAA
jgi:hypothetical protein